MGRDTYSGGGTIICPGDGNTHWGGSFDPAEKKHEKYGKGKRSRRQTTARRGRRRTQTGIQAQTEIQEREKFIRSFISQCAYAYAGGTLTATVPAAPNGLRAAIGNAGGNIKWLEGSSENLHRFFHKQYCQALGKEISIDLVWARRR